MLIKNLEYIYRTPAVKGLKVGPAIFYWGIDGWTEWVNQKHISMSYTSSLLNIHLKNEPHKLYTILFTTIQTEKCHAYTFRCTICCLQKRFWTLSAMGWYLPFYLRMGLLKFLNTVYMVYKHYKWSLHNYTVLLYMCKAFIVPSSWINLMWKVFSKVFTRSNILRYISASTP